jgi:hypothetical protein
MNFKTHNEKKSIATCGTCLQGYITVSYSTLKRIFGKPTVGDGHKTDAEWEIEFADGTVATIYNYKDGKNYCGSEGTAKTKITEWHIGGKAQKAVELVTELIREETEGE